MLGIQPAEPHRLIRAPQFDCGSLGEREEVIDVPSPDGIACARSLELLDCVVPNGLEHEEATSLSVPQQALVDERLELVKIGCGDISAASRSKLPGKTASRVKRDRSVSSSKP